MMYCPKEVGYVDQNETCINCKYYLHQDDDCSYPFEEKDEDK